MVPVWVVAQALDRPRSTILNWAQSGKIPAVKDDQGRWLVDGVEATKLHEETEKRQRLGRVELPE